MVLLGADGGAGMDVVAVDDRRGAQKAVSHLLELGHRSIGFLDAARQLGNSEKFEGYERALKRHGIKVDPKLVVDPRGHGETSGYEAMPELMSGRKRPTALFCPTDNLALGALAWCRDNGIAVPHEFSIVGYDNIEAARFADVPLTTINYAADAVSDRAIERLLSLVSNDAQAAKVTLIDPELVVRKSSAEPPRGKSR